MRWLRRLVPVALLLASTLLAWGVLEAGLRLGGWRIDLQSEWMLGGRFGRHIPTPSSTRDAIPPNAAFAT